MKSLSLFWKYFIKRSSLKTMAICNFFNIAQYNILVFRTSAYSELTNCKTHFQPLFFLYLIEENLKTILVRD